MNTDCAIILLAAGSSSRLGRPKQLVQFNESSLLRHTIAQALESEASPVVLVLGAHAEMIAPEAKGFPVTIVENKDWSEGMASSIRCGLEELLRIHPACQAAILMVCDQPLLTAAVINKLVKAFKDSGKPIIASGFAGTTGPPVLFHKTFFPELLSLQGDTGARKIVEKHAASVQTIPFPGGQIDIDTPSDYQSLQSGKPQKG